MQFKYLAAILSSTAVSGVIAGPAPVINARALEAREEQAEQLQQAQQMQQAQQAQQAKQAAQMQQVNQGAQVQQAGQAAQVQQGTNAPAAEPKKGADPKTDSAAFPIPFFGGGGSGGGITLNYDPVIDPSRRYPYYPDPFYPRPIYPDVYPPVIYPDVFPPPNNFNSRCPNIQFNTCNSGYCSGQFNNGYFGPTCYSYFAGDYCPCTPQYVPPPYFY